MREPMHTRTPASLRFSTAANGGEDIHKAGFRVGCSEVGV